MTPIRCLAALLLATAVAACEQGQPTPATQSETCKIEQTAEVPVRIDRGHILVEATIDYTPVQMLVDTGASTSMLTPEAAQSLGLPTDSYRNTIVHGIGGNIVTHNVMIRSLKVGTQDWQGGSISTGHLSWQFHEDPPLAGILGADHLDNFDVELDIPHRRMVLWRVQHCEGDFVPWHVPHFAIRLARYQPNRMVTHVQIDGHPVTALIDWGMNSTVMTTATAAALGVTPQMLARDRSGTSSGADQNELPLHAHPFAEVVIGPTTFRNVPIGVADLNVTDVGMLLGVDYVTSRHVWLSYASDQMFVEQRPTPAPTASP
jgi:predicted aspartyl protease